MPFERWLQPRPVEDNIKSSTSSCTIYSTPVHLLSYSVISTICNAIEKINAHNPVNLTKQYNTTSTLNTCSKGPDSFICNATMIFSWAMHKSWALISAIWSSEPWTPRPADDSYAAVYSSSCQLVPGPDQATALPHSLRWAQRFSPRCTSPDSPLSCHRAAQMCWN